MAIHPTAVIDPQAEIDSTVDIGPYVVIEGPVHIGAHTSVRAHAYLNGWTRVGEHCEIHPFAVVGHFPQDFHYHGERSYCEVGDRVTIREGVTIHRGTQPESSTVIGDDCLLMAYSHVGHNCVLARSAKVFNLGQIAGHVDIGEGAIVSASALVHQFVRIGSLAFVAAAARITMDVPPFLTAYGESTVVQHNLIGMRRAGYDAAAAHEIRCAFRTLYRSGLPFREAVAKLASEVQTDAGRQLLAFLQAPSKRGICAAGRSHRLRADAGSRGRADNDE